MATTQAAKKARQIADEHEALRKTMAQLLKADDAGRISGLLLELRDELEQHFAEEEGEDGLIAALPSTLPHQVTKLERVFAEHREFLSTIGDLGKSVAAIEQEVASVRQDIRRLCDSLHDHERHETDLLQEALNTDIGAGD